MKFPKLTGAFQRVLPLLVEIHTLLGYIIAVADKVGVSTTSTSSEPQALTTGYPGDAISGR